VSGPGEACAKLLFDDGWDEVADVAIVEEDVLDRAGADEGVFSVRHEEDGLDVGVKFSIDVSHLEFEFEVGDGAEAANDEVSAAFSSQLNGQAGEVGDLNVGELARDGSEHVDAFGEGENGCFVNVMSDADDECVEEARGMANDVEVPVGESIKGSRIEGDDVARGSGWFLF
jgi:hypothetical protein